MCGSTKGWVTRKGTEYLVRTEGGLLCRKCYDKHIHSPRRNNRRLRFNKTRITLGFVPRKGRCSIVGCSGSITDIHHIEYIMIFPMAMTVELCDTHHKEENLKQEKEQREYYFDFGRTWQLAESMRIMEN